MQDIEHYTCVKDRDGCRLHDGEKILDRRQEHFNKISNIEFPNVSILPISSIHYNFRSSDAVSKIKNANASGPDDLPLDIWKIKYLQIEEITWLTDFFNVVIEFRHSPSDW